jgi:hypothetical protein
MPPLRVLNEAGVEQFRRFLAMIRAGERFQESPALLYVDDYSRPLRENVRIESRKFKRKIDAAVYLQSLLQPIEYPGMLEDVGLWSWLALFYFDQIAPPGADGKRMPREDYHYIPARGSWYQYRHLLSSAYEIYSTHGERGRIILHPPVNQHGRFAWQLAWRRDLITNRGLIEAIDRLYWDAKKKRPKRGASVEERGGSLHRFIDVVQQLDLNYDLHGMTAEQIIALLPEEFEEWKG